MGGGKFTHMINVIICEIVAVIMNFISCKSNLTC